MPTTRGYLELVRARTTTKSNYAIAKMLDLSEDRIAFYLKGKRIMDNDACRRIAEVLHLPLEEVIAAAEIERAQRDGDEARERAWTLRLKALGQSVAAAACAYLMATAFPDGGIAAARPAPSWRVASASACGADATPENNITTNYTKWKRRAWGALRAMLRRLAALTPPLPLTAP